MSTNDPDEISTGDLRVFSDIAPNGAYITTVQAGPDVVFALDPDSGVRYARYVMSAVARAEHDAAVLAQLLGHGIEKPAIADLVRALRDDRPPLTSDWPISFEPLVSGRTQEPRVTVAVNGEPAGQYGTHSLIDHVVAVLEVVHGVDLDAAYRRHLVGVIGIDERQATATVAALGEHHQRT